MGTPVDFIARSTYALNIFQAGGFQVINNDGFTDPSAAAAAFVQSHSGIAVICSSDKKYGQVAEETARRLKASGARTVILLETQARTRQRTGRLVSTDSFLFDVMSWARSKNCSRRKESCHEHHPEFQRGRLGRRPRATAHLADWVNAAGRPPEELERLTPELIAIKPLYSSADLKGLEHLHGMPGLPPFVRGPYVTMYARDRGRSGNTPASRPPRIPTPSTAATWPPARRACRVAFDLPTHRGYDSDHPRVAGRRRHGRRRHRQHPRHAHPVRRHSARRDQRLDDDERRRAAGHGPVHRRGRGAGREAGATRRHHPERHPQGVHGPQHLHLSARAEHADHRAISSTTPASRCRSSTASASPATTCRKPAPPPTSSWATRWPTAWNTSAPASRPA